MTAVIDPTTSGPCTLEELGAFGQTVIAPRADDHYRREQLDVDAWRQLADLGLWRIPVPEHLGGFGGNWRELADGIRMLARTGGDLGFVLSLVAHAGLVRAVVEFGTAAHHDRFLPDLLGGAVGATALTETRGGSDVSRTATEAAATAGGYRLCGAKDHITNGPVADVALVLGRIPQLGSGRDISLFLVDCHQPGVRHGSPEELLGLRSSPTGPIHFEAVDLPADAVLGPPGNGLQLLYNIISYDRLLYGLIAGGFLEARLEEALNFCRDRVAFGAPILEYQYVQGRLTDIKLTIETTTAVSNVALDALMNGDADATLRASVAKLVGSEGLAAAATHLLALHGHLGYVRGPISKVVQDALGTLIAGGTTEMQRKNIFNQMIHLSARAQP